MSLPAWVWGVLDLWLFCRPGNNVKLMPGAGGPGDQAAWLMEALAIVDDEIASLSKGGDGGG